MELKNDLAPFETPDKPANSVSGAPLGPRRPWRLNVGRSAGAYRLRLNRLVTWALVVLVFLSLGFTYYSVSNTVSAATGINHQINFQGKLVNPSGTNVTDGSYSIVFSIYTVAAAGSNIWTETQTVTVTNGIFQVNLGSVTTLPGSIDFNTDNIYLGIKVGADAEMTPRVQFTAVPQSFNSEKLGGLDKTGFVQNTTTQQATSNFNISGAGVVGTSLTTPLLQAAAATALTITGNAASTWSTSAGNITLQAGSGTISLGSTTTLSSTGALTISGGTTLALTSTGANAISLDSGTTGAVNIGVSANAKTVTIGNITGATGVVVNCGTNGCSFGASATAHLTTLGSINSTSTTTLQSGTGGVNIGTGGIANTIQIGSTTGAVAQNINIGTNGTASSTNNVVIGSTIAGTTTIQNVGTISLNAGIVVGNATTQNLFNTIATTMNFAGAATTLSVGSATGTTTFNGNLAVAAGKTFAVGTGASTLGGTLGVTGAITGSSTVQGTQLISTVATGTAPLTVTSTTVVTNLNADMVDGLHAASFAASSGSASYIQNGTGLQTSANFNIQSAAAASVGGIIKGAVSQTADLFQLQNSGGTVLTGVSNDGALYFQNGNYRNPARRFEIYGDTQFNVNRIMSYAPTGQTPSSLAFTVFGADAPYTTPKDVWTVGPTGAMTTTLLSASSIGYAIKGAASQTADLFQLQNSSGAVMSKFDASGNLSVGTSTSPTGGVATFNGNVGIGTTTPTATLQVSHTAYVAGETPSFKLTGAHGDAFLMEAYPNNTAGTYGGIGIGGATEFLMSPLAGYNALLGTTTAADLNFLTNATARMVIQSGGNVGIGTTSPAAKLTVAGSTSVNGSLLVGASSALGDFVQFNDTFDGSTINTGNWTVQGTASQSGSLSITGHGTWGDDVTSVQSYRRSNTLTLTADISAASTNNYFMIGFSSDASGTYSTMPHAIYFVSGGTMGIWENGTSTATPAYTWAGGTTYRIRISVTSTGARYYISSNGGDTWTLLYDGTGNNVTNSPLYVRTSVYGNTSPTVVDNVSVSNGEDVFSSSQFFDKNLTIGKGNLLINTGNVGIGTSSPGYKLDVAGDINTSGSFRVNGVAVLTGAGNYIQNGTGLQASANFDIQSAAAGSVGGIIEGAVSQTADLFQLQNSSGAVMSKFDASGNLSVGTSTSPTGGVATFNGNVGIGTTAPVAQLHSVGKTTSSSATTGSYTGGGRGFPGWDAWLAGNSSIPGAGSGGNTMNGTYLGGTAGGLFYGGNGNYTSGAGAGVTAIGGNGDTYGEGGAGIYAQGGTNGSWFNPNVTPYTSAPAGYFNGNVFVMNGNVGIGTTSPGQKLDVRGIGTFTNGADYVSLDGTTTNKATLAIGNASVAAEFTTNLSGSTDAYGVPTSAVGLGTAQGFPLVFSTSASEKMRITSTGNVGIGTTSPGYKLEVTGIIGAPGFAYTTTLYNGTDFVADTNSPQMINFNVTYTGYNPAHYYKVARIKLVGSYQGVSLSGFFTEGAHEGTEQRTDFEFVTNTFTSPGSPQTVYSKRGMNTEDIVVYQVPNGGGANTTYYDIYLKQQWYNGGFGQLTINQFGGPNLLTLWQAGSDTGTTAPADTLLSPNGGYNFDTTGSIGIGTIAPGYKLDVQGGDINTSGNLRTGGTIRLDNAGNLSNIGTITSGLINGQTISAAANFTGTVVAAGSLTGANVISTGNLGFHSNVWTANVPNPIWSFGNASAYGLAYYQGSALAIGDAIGFHFGNVAVPVVTIATNGAITGATLNATTGFQVAGAATTGNYLRGNGTNFVSSALQAADLPSGSGSYIQNGTALQASSNFHISGTGSADTSITTPLLDTATAVPLNIGTTNASVINLNENTTVAANKSFTANGDALFKDATNSATALQVQNLSAAPVLTVDTITSQTILTSANTDAVLGAAIIDTAGGTNDFPTGWAATNWTTAANSATHVTGNTSALSSTWLPTFGTTYQVTYTYSACSAANTLGVTMGGITLEPTTSCIGTNTQVITATNSAALTFTPNSTYIGVVSNVVIKALTTQVGSVLTVKNSSSVATLEVRSSGSTSNIFIGLNAGKNNTSSGVYNTALGTNALQANTTGTYNTASGTSALRNNTTGTQNTASGFDALLSNTTGAYNIATGSYALYSNTTGTYNTASGYAALNSNTTGTYNTAAGYSALQSNTTGAYNIATGTNALQANTTGTYNTAAGASALQSNTTGGQNTATGTNALQANTTGIYNTASGTSALYSTATGNSNTATGHSALYSLKTLTGTISATATNAGKAQFTSTSTTGLVAGLAVTIYGTTSYNGSKTIQSVDSGTTFTITDAYSTADAAGSWTTADSNYNTAEGYQAGSGSAVYTATGNSLFGNQTGLNLQSGANYNSLFGYSAGSGITTGTQNVLLGYNAGTNLTTGSNNVLIGQGVTAPVATGSNQLQIGVGISGDLSTGTLAVKTATNSATAFQLQTAAGASVLNASTNSPNGNVIPNPSVEVNTTGWVARAGTTLTRTTTAANVYYGIGAAQAVNTATANSGINYPIQLAPNTAYGIHVMLKMTVNGTVSFGYAADGVTETTYVNATGYGGNAGTGWYYAELSFTTPATINAGAYIFINQNDASARTMYIDGLRAESGLGYYYQDNQINLGDSATGVLIGASPSNMPTSTGASLLVQQTRNGTGLIVRGTSENDLFKPQIFTVQSSNASNILAVGDDAGAQVGINGGSGFWGSAALNVLTNDSGARGLSVAGVGGQTADLLQVWDAPSSNKIFSVGGTGDTTIKTSTNSTAAFMVQNSAGAGILSVDTVSNIVRIENKAMANDTSNLLLQASGGADASSIRVVMGAHPSATAASRYGYVGSGDGGAMRMLALNSNGAGAFGDVGIGTISNYTGYQLSVFNTAAGVAIFDRSTDGGIMSFASGGTIQGTISIAGATTSYNAFTGSHYAHITSGTLERGMLAALTGTSDHANGAAEPIYGVVKSQTANQPNILGAYLARFEPDQAYSLDNPELVMAAGNGDIWIADNGSGNVNIGDPLISSTLPGYAMRDPKTFATSHVFAKVAEPIDWSTVTTTVQGVKVAKVTGLFSFYNSDNVNDHLQGSTMGVTGDATIGGNLNVSGATSLTDLTVSGSANFAGDLTVQGNTSVMNLTINGHLITAGSAPVASIQAAAGMNALATIVGNDTSGTITITTGDPATDSTAAPTFGELVKILFNQPFGKAPQVDLTPGDAAAADLRWWRSSSTDSFSLNVNATPAVNTAYSFDYFVRQ